MKFELRFNDEDQLIWPKLHDAKIKSITFNDDQVEFLFYLSDDRFVVVFEDVWHLNGSGVAAGNVVLQAFRLFENDLSFVEFLNIVAPINCEAGSVYRAKLIDMVSRGELSCLQVSPSIGGEFIVLYRSAYGVDSKSV